MNGRVLRMTYGDYASDFDSLLALDRSVSIHQKNLQVIATLKNVSTVRYGTESLSFIAPKIWSLMTEDIKKSPTLEIFKLNIKNWKTNECPNLVPRAYCLSGEGGEYYSPLPERQYALGTRLINAHAGYVKPTSHR